MMQQILEQHSICTNRRFRGTQFFFPSQAENKDPYSFPILETLLKPYLKTEALRVELISSTEKERTKFEIDPKNPFLKALNSSTKPWNETPGNFEENSKNSFFWLKRFLEWVKSFLWSGPHKKNNLLENEKFPRYGSELEKWKSQLRASKNNSKNSRSPQRNNNVTEESGFLSVDRKNFLEQEFLAMKDGPDQFRELLSRFLDNSISFSGAVLNRINREMDQERLNLDREIEKLRTKPLSLSSLIYTQRSISEDNSIESSDTHVIIDKYVEVTDNGSVANDSDVDDEKFYSADESDDEESEDESSFQSVPDNSFYRTSSDPFSKQLIGTHLNEGLVH
eukprot:TRINITY_DN9748_c0_g1_i1.p1 TRINITY_DN9748_c0_g1~~TRINITY_DN9748_c0_g1_i1.p1  ORF type:complete len:337 (+),score=65.70 TRINITY_DN9748_c0_g1_i1:34-1044(+)